MKKFTKISLFPFLLVFLAPFGLKAANWHPFPFQAAYYSRPAELGTFYGLSQVLSNGPLVKGKVIEGMYLDSSYQTINGMRIRSRSHQYPFGMPGDGYGFEAKVNFTFISTPADSGRVVWYSKHPYSSDFDSLVFFPGNQGLGINLPSVKTMETIFGISDSVSILQIGSEVVKWSKNFGLLEFSRSIQGLPTTLKLEGVKDLGLGWRPFTGKPAKPAVGDEFHFRRYKKYENLGGGSLCIPGTENTFEDLRIKVNTFPYQGDTNQALYDVVVSPGNGNTGISYGRILGTDPYWEGQPGSSFSEPGTFTDIITGSFSGFSAGHFIDSLGITLYYRVPGLVIDGGPVIDFLPCSYNLFSKYEQFSSIGSPTTCNSRSMELIFPVYIQSQNGCTMGTPLPPVTITQIQPIAAVSGIGISPNPALTHLQIQLYEASGREVEFLLVDALGKSKKGILPLENGGAIMKLDSAAPGLYTLRIQSSGNVWTRKVVVE
jgi:hypothetical protein